MFAAGQPDQIMGAFTLEAGIAPLVAALNARGVVTSASCEGHTTDALARVYVLFYGCKAGQGVVSHYLSNRHRLYLPWKMQRSIVSDRLRYTWSLDLWRVKSGLFFLPEKFAWSIIKYLQSKDVQQLSKLTLKVAI